MIRFRSLCVLALLAGCASFEKKPPPETVEAPPEEAAGEPDPIPDGGAPPKPADKEPPPTEPAKRPDPQKHDFPGIWTSTAFSGPGSAPVRRVDMVFNPDGAWSASMILDVDGSKRFQSLDGRWSLSDGKLAIKFTDGRERLWSPEWTSDELVLKDGEAELRLKRVEEAR